MGNSVFFFSSSSFFLSQTKVMVIMRMMMTIAICRARICPRNKSILTALKKMHTPKKKKKKRRNVSGAVLTQSLRTDAYQGHSKERADLSMAWVRQWKMRKLQVRRLQQFPSFSLTDTNSLTY